jgi:hypothetical protein
VSGSGRATRFRFPIWPCSAWGLPCPRRCRRGGALLPRRFTLTVLPLSESQGGLFSVALSFASPRPGITRHAARSEFGLSSPISRGDHVGPLGAAAEFISCQFSVLSSRSRPREAIFDSSDPRSSPAIHRRRFFRLADRAPRESERESSRSRTDESFFLRRRGRAAPDGDPP